MNEEEIKREVKETEVTPTPVQTQNTDVVENGGVEGETLTPSEVPTLNTEPVPTVEQERDATLDEDNGDVNKELEKMLPQSQVSELIGNTRTETREKTRAEVMNEFYNRYGVSNDEELDGIFGRGQNYDILNDNYNTQSSQLREVMAENALLKTGIAENRWGDAKAILASKGLEVNQDNILLELETHPEWRAVPSMEAGVQPTKPLTPQDAEQMVQNTRGPMTPHNGEPSVIRRLGTEGEEPPTNNEDEEMKRLFGIQKY